MIKALMLLILSCLRMGQPSKSLLISTCVNSTGAQVSFVSALTSALIYRDQFEVFGGLYLESEWVPGFQFLPAVPEYSLSTS